MIKPDASQLKWLRDSVFIGGTNIRAPWINSSGTRMVMANNSTSAWVHERVRVRVWVRCCVWHPTCVLSPVPNYNPITIRHSPIPPMPIHKLCTAVRGNSVTERHTK